MMDSYVRYAEELRSRMFEGGKWYKSMQYRYWPLWLKWRCGDFTYLDTLH